MTAARRLARIILAVDVVGYSLDRRGRGGDGELVRKRCVGSRG